MIELDSTLIGNFGFSVIRLTTPIIFATMSAVIASRAGVANIGIEGMMLVSALAGVIVSSATQSLWATLLIVPVLGALLGLLFIVIVEKLKSNAVLTGLAFNIMASGGTVFVLWLLTGDKGASTSLKSLVVPFLEIPGLQNVPILGTILSHHSALTYFAFVCVGVVHVLLYKTGFGLRIRAVGENEDAAKSVGINVYRVRVVALMLSGLLASFGGMFMSMAYLSWFSTNMVAGRGFIGLVTEVMGKGTPIGGMLVSFVFGLADALSNTLQTRLSVPSELVQMLPYLVTIVGLAVVGLSAKKKNLRGGR